MKRVKHINFHTWFVWTTCKTCGLHVERVKHINLRMCSVWSTHITCETHAFHMWIVWSTCGTYETHDPPHVDPVVHMWKKSSPHASHVTPTCEPHVYSCVFRTKHVKHTFFRVFHMCFTQNHMEFTCEIHGVLP